MGTTENGHAQSAHNDSLKKMAPDLKIQWHTFVPNCAVPNRGASNAPPLWHRLLFTALDMGLRLSTLLKTSSRFFWQLEREWESSLEQLPCIFHKGRLQGDEADERRREAEKANPPPS